MMTYHCSDWASVLIKHRESQKLSLLQLSNRTGISRNTLIALEKGSKKVHPKTKQKLENYFEAYLLQEELASAEKLPAKERYYKGKHRNVYYLF